jgi:hypothetical protein
MSKRKYEIGRWYRHNGVGNPVPIGTKVDIQWFHNKRESGSHGESLGRINTNTGTMIAWENVTAFRVAEYPPDETTWTGKCSAWAQDGFSPVFSDFAARDAAQGTYAVTSVDGKPTRITWEATE